MRVLKPLCCAAAPLPAGTYLFKLADPDHARHVVIFGESPARAPQAIEAMTALRGLTVARVATRLARNRSSAAR